MNNYMRLTPLQTKYVLKLLRKDKPENREEKYFKKTLMNKCQEVINDFARRVGHDVEQGLKNLKNEDSQRTNTY